MSESSDLMRQVSVASSGLMDDYVFDDDEEDVVEHTQPEQGDTMQSFVCLNPEDIVEEQLSSVREVNDIFEISPSVARALLVHCKWDKERLLELYYSGSQEKLFADAHVVNPNKQRRKAPKMDESRCCDICYCDWTLEEMAALECEHYFCLGCWDQYLHTQVAAMIDNIKCPNKECAVGVDEYTVSNLLKDPACATQYKKLISRSFVRDNPRVAWCPRPGCENAIKVAMIEPCIVTCLCGYSFCFACRQSEHVPIACGLLRMWIRSVPTIARRPTGSRPTPRTVPPAT